MTIGTLSERTGVPRSALRYYEERGIVTPHSRSSAGYRLYGPLEERRVRLVQSAQRLGFSLGDIRGLLGAEDATEDVQMIARIADERFLENERRVTQLLVLQHELRHFLDDLAATKEESAALRQIANRVCRGAPDRASPERTLDWLLQKSGCEVISAEGERALETLKGRHFHIWWDKNGYRVLIVDRSPQVRMALERLERLEERCQVHRRTRLESHPEGLLFVVPGPHAFLYAQLFLSLEQMTPRESGR